MFADRLAFARRALAEGNHDQAVLIVAGGLAEARRRFDRGDGDALAWTAVLTDELDALTEDVLEPAERTGPWEDLRALARRAGAAAAELGSVLRLAVLHLRADRPEVAAEHAAAVLDLVSRNGVLRAKGVRVDEPDPTTIHEVLTDVAHDLYYRREDFAAAEALADGFAGCYPDSPVPWYFLGHSAARLEHHEAAVRALTRLAELVPDLPGPLVSLSGSLFHVDRRAEAVAALTQAIELAPDEARYRCFRARMHAADGRAEDALADVDEVIGTARVARDLADFAAVLRLNLLVDLGRLAEAAAGARVLADTGDEPTAGAAYAVLGDLAFDGGDYPRAIVCFTAQLDRHESAEALLSRATAYEAADLLDAAAADLDALALLEPARAVEALTGLRERHPTHGGTAKALGHALLRLRDPARAVEELTEAHRRLPGDWQVVAWLGLAQVTHSAADDEWNDGFSGRRVLDAVGRLTDAVLMAPDEPHPRHHLRWLVDRACALPPIRDFLVHARDLPRGFGPGGADLAAALPDVADLLAGWSRALPPEEEPARGESSLTALAALRARIHDLPVFGALVDLRLAEVHLRLYQVPAALDLVAGAEEALDDVGRTPGDRFRGEFPEPLSGLDFDHVELTAAVHTELRKSIAVHRSRALHRLGDLDGALEAADHGLGDDDFDHLYRRTTLLRDVGRLDEAVAQLPRLTGLAGRADRTRLANLEATLHLSRREFDAAAGVLERVLPTVEPDSYDASVFVTNLISVHLERAEPAAVLDLIDRYPLPAGAPSSLLLNRHAMRAVALTGLGEHRAAAAGFRAALAIAEDVRGGLLDRAARLSWEATHLWVYEQAVLVALAAGDPAGAWELVRRAKAHEFDRPGADPSPGAEVRVPDGCVLAEFFVAADRVLLFVLSPGRAEPEVHQWEAESDELVGWFFDRSVRELDQEAFAVAFGPMVAPITDRCAPGDVIVLVPHEVLHHLPLHALLLGRNPVCRLPSATLPPSRPDRRWDTAVVLGDSRGDLVHSREEAARVAAVFGTRPVLGVDATRLPAVGADVLHLACRGRGDGEPAVLLADGHELTASDIGGPDRTPGLVTWSASGFGDDPAGFARAVLHAGVPSVVVSLWEVDDLSTTLLMADFYTRLRAGAGLADALRDAQVALAATAAREVVAYCDDRLTGVVDPVAAAGLLLDRAGAQTAAGDLGRAAATCREVGPALAGTRGGCARRLRERAARRLNLLALKAESPPPVDYAARPFAHPYHWAAFVLVGDWR
ncbi:CHAT domain-containing protein [Actinosynnema sp. NPDC047251]|uniref:CHAT domain-containing protein n=1 Tax=Saccharothrix espanaensis (strain ATCC 51144 / DSM 44229 / JCM 9112 / NBRC 15066 / NRRL 15764) TaxID=1179773 RepID=K0K277_SACES|nr:CHAT domain-containing protein [Saccharothrix espanaensis]CCH34355.1 hypothetical protein BN6_71200 [Saccharothrix espanaensis DSM 44229]